MTDQLQYLEKARELLNELAETPPRVPYEPELLPMLFSATRENSSASMDDIARLIERSQNLATRLLNIANSAYYVLEFKVTSLSRAISVLGLKEVRSLVLTVCMITAIKGVKLPKTFDTHALWVHHIRTATYAKALTAAIQGEAAPKKLGPENKLSFDPDEAYVAGLLHDIGKVFLASSRPEVWQAIQDMCKAENIEHSEAEMELWGMDHGILGSRVLHTWKVPLLLTDAINWHHAPQLAPQGRLEAGLLSAANRLDNAGFTPGDPIDAEIMELLPQGVDEETLREAFAERLANDRNAALAVYCN